MKSIPLTRGFSCLVDDQDFAAVGNFKWRAGGNGRFVYAAREVDGSTVYLHRLLMGFPEGHVDHINGNTLDNTRSNLRAVTAAVNNHNRVGPVRAASGHRGVLKTADGYIVRFVRGGKRHYGGSYKSVEEALPARDRLIAELEAVAA